VTVYTCWPIYASQEKRESKRQIIIFFSFISILRQRKEAAKLKVALSYIFINTYAQKMIFNIYLLYFIILFFGTINALPAYRYLHQMNSQKTGGLSDQPSARTSGSIKGTYYYGEYKFHALIIFVSVFSFIYRRWIRSELWFIYSATK